MIYNILNGDSLAYSFPDTKIEGDIIVVREGLIDGDLSGNDLQDFWHSRAKYMGLTEAEYHDKVVSEFEELIRLAKNQSFAFPYLQEVVKAHIDRFPKDGTNGRPEKVIEDITKNISTDFHKVFIEFWNRESIYGFGDSQLKHLYDKVMHYR